MGALAATIPTNTGTAAAPAAVAASDTVARSLMPNGGAALKIINAGAGTDNITISDPGQTPALNPLPSGQISGSVANGGAAKWFQLRAAQCDPVTGLITITHSQPTGVTYELIPY